MEMNCVEKDVAARIKQLYGGKRAFIMGRSANLTAPHNNRTNCQYRNKCWLGCPFGAYFSTQSATLPAAMATGNLTLRPFSIVTRILYDKDTQKAKGVEVLDAETNKTYEYYAKVVFVCASAFNSSWILMNSATDVWEGGLGSSSGELGHNVMDHHLKCGASGRVEGYDDKYYFGKRPNGIYVDQQAEVGHKRFWFDGQSIHLYEPETGNFAEETLKGNSDKALEFTINQLKFSPPLADFLTSDPAKTLLKSVVKGFVVGPSIVNGIPCRHLAFLDRLIDWQIWIEEGKLPLPRKLIITYKTLPNSPQYTAILSDFDLISRLPDHLFNPQIPPSAVRLPFLKAAQMETKPKGKPAAREGVAP